MGAGGINAELPGHLPGRWLVVREVLLWLAGRRERHRVQHHSMEPNASDGDFLLVNPRAYRDCAPQVGDWVIARHPLKVDLIVTKRVLSVSELGVELRSDNPDQGQDSRHFGPVPPDLIRGRVTCVIR